MHKKRKKPKPVRSPLKVFLVSVFFTVFLCLLIFFVAFVAYETITVGYFQTLYAWTARFTGTAEEPQEHIPEIPLPQPINEQPIINYIVGGEIGGDEIDYPPRDLRYISWPFFTYYLPCFYSKKIGDHPPGKVDVLYEQHNWALIYTQNGEAWVYLGANKLYVNRRMGLFDAKEGELLSHFDPTLVYVLARYGRWIEIDAGWIYLDFAPPIHLLEEFVGQFGNTVSVFYQNMATGFYFSHYGDRPFFGASATKAPFALYIYLKAERGEAGMDTHITFTAADFWEGSGIIRHRYSYGATFTQKRLLELMLAPSDNIATRMLRRHHGLTGYREFIESIGANPDFVQNLTYSHLSANDAGIFMREAYLYIESGGRYGEHLRDNLLANRYAFIISNYPVASKSGWAANHGAAWHDMAIIYAPSPYVLALLSSRVGNAADRAVYNSISMFVQKFNNKWFGP